MRRLLNADHDVVMGRGSLGMWGWAGVLVGAEGEWLE
jgi:hypothetical protein